MRASIDFIFNATEIPGDNGGGDNGGDKGSSDNGGGDKDNYSVVAKTKPLISTVIRLTVCQVILH